MKGLLIKGGTIFNEGKIFKGNIAIHGDFIVAPEKLTTSCDIIDASGLWVLPGVIDDQVHFREPGLEDKGTIYTESMAAVAGGVTSFMEMPNTNPPTINAKLLEAKFEIAKNDSWCNYSFYLGATNTNTDEVKSIDPIKVCGVKVFMGSSTGDLLVDDHKALENIFSKAKVPIAVHSEDEITIKTNLEKFKRIYRDNALPNIHPKVRSEEACVKCTEKAINYCRNYGGHLHLLHISTAKEVEMIKAAKLEGINITAEVCIHHLWFSADDYEQKGNFIKWNPSIKSTFDRESLIKGLIEGTIDIVATDHAPHEKEKKLLPYFTAPSGGPSVQYSLLLMLEIAKKRNIAVTDVVNWMSHKPANLFKISKRGFLREGYYADLVLVDPRIGFTIKGEGSFSKVKWSPFEGVELNHSVNTTIVNGNVIYRNDLFFAKNKNSAPLQFYR